MAELQKHGQSQGSGRTNYIPTGGGQQVSSSQQSGGKASTASSASSSTPGANTINDALMDYEALTGQPAGSLNDLVSSGVLANLPDPPAGMEWQYNPQTGTVTAVQSTT